MPLLFFVVTTITPVSFVILFFSMLLSAYTTNCSEVEKPYLYYSPLTDTIVYNESAEDFANPARGFLLTGLTG